MIQILQYANSIHLIKILLIALNHLFCFQLPSTLNYQFMGLAFQILFLFLLFHLIYSIIRKASLMKVLFLQHLLLFNQFSSQIH